MTFQTSHFTLNVSEYMQNKSYHHSYDPVLLQEAYDGLGIYIPFAEYKEPLGLGSNRPTCSDSYFINNNAWDDYGNSGHPVSHYPPDYTIFQPGYGDSRMAYNTLKSNTYNPWPSKQYDALDNRSSAHMTETSKDYTRDDYTVPNSPESINSDLSSVSSATGLPAKNKEETDVKKIHACDFCDRKFARKYDAHRHIRIHTGNKPYVCPCCRKCFARSDARTRHVRKEPACFAFSKKLDMIQRTRQGKE